MKLSFAAYFAALLVVAALDFVWLGLVATQWYQAGIGHLMASQPRVGAAAAFYLLYPVGLVLFAVGPAQGNVARALRLGGLFGLFAYGTYDVTSLAILRDWPLGLSLLDTAWGGCVSAAASAAGATIWRRAAAY